MKRLFLFFFLAFIYSAWAAPPGTINQYNALCNPSFPTRCAAVDASGNVSVTGSFSANFTNFTPTGAASLAVTSSTARVATQRSMSAMLRMLHAVI